jgi:hypothetical protein
MQCRNHVVVVVSLLVPGPSADVRVRERRDLKLCASDIDAECLSPPLPTRPGQHVIEWGVTVGCFSPKL